MFAGVACLRFIRYVGRVRVEDVIHHLSGRDQHVFSALCFKGLFLVFFVQCLGVGFLLFRDSRFVSDDYVLLGGCTARPVQTVDDLLR